MYRFYSIPGLEAKTRGFRRERNSSRDALWQLFQIEREVGVGYAGDVAVLGNWGLGPLQVVTT